MKSYINWFPCNVLDVAAEEAMELEEEDLIEIAEEADLIQADRIIEDNIDFHGDGDWRYAEDSVREIEEMMLAMNVDNMDIQAEQGKDEWEVNFRDFSFGVMWLIW